MKNKLLLTLVSLTTLSLMTGCNMKMPYTDTEESAVVGTSQECLNLEKKIMKIDRFTKVVENKSAFHLEEAAIAYEIPQVSVSNNKPEMLRDAAKKKAALVTEQEKLNCASSDEV